MTDLILSHAAAEARVSQLALRRYKGKDADAIEAAVREQHDKLVGLGRRMLKQSAYLGVALEALRQASPHGTYMERLERLNISKSTADRFRQLATFEAALPKNPPPEIYGDVWTNQSALEFGRELQALEGDFPDLPEGERVTRAVRRVQSRRTRNTSANLTIKVAKLEAEIMSALSQGDAGANAAAAMLREAGQRAARAAEDYSRDVPAGDDEIT